MYVLNRNIRPHYSSAPLPINMLVSASAFVTGSLHSQAPLLFNTSPLL